MILKKSLKSGQASLEYFLIFAAILGLTLLSASTFFPAVRRTIQGGSGRTGFFQKVSTGLLTADQG